MRSPAGETRTSQTVALPKSFAMGTIGGAWAASNSARRSIESLTILAPEWFATTHEVRTSGMVPLEQRVWALVPLKRRV